MADKQTVIGPETRISGEVRGEEDLLIRGRVEGKIQLSETLTIDEGGIVQADVEVKVLVVSGVLVGTIRASDSVRLTDKARVVGDIQAPRFVMEAGAAYRGRIDMGEGANVPARKSAAAGARPAPPRMASPGRASAPSANSVVRAPAPPSAPPRVTSAPPRPSAPPSLPRPDLAASGSAGPSWAKKKLRRR